MIRALRIRRSDAERILWLFALGVFGFGCYFIEGRYQTKILATQTATESLYRATAANERALAERARLRRVRSIAERDLRRIAHNLPLSLTTAETLRLLQESAAAHGVRIEDIETEQAQDDAHAADDTLSGTQLLLRVRGSFRNVLWFIGGFSNAHTLLSVSDTQLALTQRRQNTPVPLLDANIHMTLYRLNWRNLEDPHEPDR